jgi:hypothetical protein
MDDAIGERRAEPRLPAAALQIERATLRPGCLVAVLDLSAIGAQVQSERPLRPGSRIHVRIARAPLDAGGRCGRGPLQRLDPAGGCGDLPRGAEVRGGVHGALGRADGRSCSLVIAQPRLTVRVADVGGPGQMTKV